MSLMIRVLVVVLIASVSGVFLSAQEAEPQGIKPINTAFERHNYKTALQLAEKYLIQQPDSIEAVEAKLIKAQCLLKLKRPDEGIVQLEALLEEDDELSQRVELHQSLESLASDLAIAGPG